MADIFHFLNIKSAETEKIYKALTEQEGLANWWTTSTEGKSEIGAAIKFRFSKDYYKEMKVIALEPNKSVEWECIHGDEQWIGTKIKFEIIQKEDSSDIKFYHSGWKDKTDLFGICNYHWGLYMKSLKSYIEDGIGNPANPQL